MDLVSKTWYREIKSPTTFYTAVTALQFFTHLIYNSVGLHKTNAVTNQASMMIFYNEDDGILQYINILEGVQAQAERAALPISNDVLVAIYNRVMLTSNNYPAKTKLWNKIVPASRKWYLWKPTNQ